MKYLFLCFIYFILFTEGLFAQKDSAIVDTQKGYTNFEDFMRTKLGSDTSLVFPQPEMDSNLIKAINKYNIFLVEHRINSYGWQLTSVKIIFIVVIIVVLMGLFLSYMQFKKSMNELERKTKRKIKKEKTETIMTNSVAETEKPEAEISQTTFEIGKEGIKISSAVIGLIILAISIAFFFLYLKYVFGINEP